MEHLSGKVNTFFAQRGNFNDLCPTHDVVRKHAYGFFQIGMVEKFLK